MTTATISKFMERTTAAGSRIDREGGVIRGVRVLGAMSRNGRRYTPKAMRSAAKHYENVRVLIGHPPRDNPTLERNVGENVGWLENVTVRDDGVFADLHVLKSHPLTGQVFEVAERNPSQIGLSHNAEGPSFYRDGEQVVEDVVNVNSVDLVLNPATNSGLFESTDPGASGDRFLESESYHYRWAGIQARARYGG